MEGKLENFRYWAVLQKDKVLHGLTLLKYLTLENEKFLSSDPDLLHFRNQSKSYLTTPAEKISLEQMIFHRAILILTAPNPEEIIKASRRRDNRIYLHHVSESVRQSIVSY